ncbi:MAG: polysaccharide deacetylase family protein [Cyclobacteriaceae bacterium]
MRDIETIINGVDGILTYHKIRPSTIGNIQRQLEFIKGQKFLVTVDDGDISFYNHLFPLLLRYNIPSILFVITGLIDTNLPFWWDEVIYSLGATKGDKKLKSLKLMQNLDRIRFLREMRTGDYKRLQQTQLSTEQLLEMQDQGIVIGNHSHSHPMFDMCTEDEIIAELKSSRSFFNKTGLNGYEYLAYPNGNFNGRVESVIKDQGIKYAFLFDHMLVRQPANPLRLSRLSVNDDTPFWKFKMIVKGWHSRVLPLTTRLHRYIHGQ